MNAKEIANRVAMEKVMARHTKLIDVNLSPDAQRQALDESYRKETAAIARLLEGSYAKADWPGRMIAFIECGASLEDVQGWINQIKGHRKEMDAMMGDYDTKTKPVASLVELATNVYSRLNRDAEQRAEATKVRAATFFSMDRKDK